MYVKRKKIEISEVLGKPSLMYKEVGYHVFNLMAFARLYHIAPKIEFFQSIKFKKCLKYLENKKYQQLLVASNIELDGSTFGKTLTKDECSINIYGYPYNVTGFELMYCLQVFGKLISEKDVESVCKTQFEQTWSDKELSFGPKCHDKVAVNYRTYEYYRYLELANE